LAVEVLGETDCPTSSLRPRRDLREGTFISR
jgi:hypothetical protein